jgi:hypothetical protein
MGPERERKATWNRSHRVILRLTRSVCNFVCLDSHAVCSDIAQFCSPTGTHCSQALQLLPLWCDPMMWSCCPWIPMIAHDDVSCYIISSPLWLFHTWQTAKKNMTAPAIYFLFFPYTITPKTIFIDYAGLSARLIICAASAYPCNWYYADSELKKSTDAWLMPVVSSLPRSSTVLSNSATSSLPLRMFFVYWPLVEVHFKIQCWSYLLQERPRERAWSWEARSKVVHTTMSVYCYQI